MDVHSYPEHSWKLERLIKKYPGMRVVFDHMGLPRAGNPVDYEVMLGLSEYPNVYMKVSNIASQSGQNTPYKNLEPLLREIVRRFTVRRMVWGGNYQGGMGSAAYAEQVATAARLMDFLSPEEQYQIFVETPRRLFKLPS